jgi:hypothetical protein
MKIAIGFVALTIYALQSVAQEQIYRCDGGVYTNTLQDPRATGCKPLEGKQADAPPAGTRNQKATQREPLRSNLPNFPPDSLNGKPSDSKSSTGNKVGGLSAYLDHLDKKPSPSTKGSFRFDADGKYIGHFDANGNPIEPVSGNVKPNPYDEFEIVAQPGKKKDSNFFADTLTPASGDKQTAPKISTVEDGDLFKGGDPSQQAKLEKYDASKLPSAGISLGIVIGAVLLAFAVCYSIFWVLGKSVQGSTPVATGRRWMNWAVLVSLMQPLTTTFSLLLIDSGNLGGAVAKGVMGVMGAFLLGIVAFASGALWAHFRHRKPTVGPTQEIRPAALPNVDSQPATPDAQTGSPSSATADEVVWEAALAEFDSSNRRAGLWAKMFSAADGNESLAKAKYLQARVTEWEAERQALAKQQAHDARRKAREIELANLTEEERAEALRPKGMCPNCDAVISLATSTCPSCRANFGKGTSWEIVPLPGT